jgi:hypothetical protein
MMPLSPSTRCQAHAVEQVSFDAERKVKDGSKALPKRFEQADPKPEPKTLSEEFSLKYVENAGLVKS